MSNVILGTDLMLFKGNKTLAFATSCKLTINANVLETSSKDSGKWVSKQAAKLSWTASSDNLFTVADYKEFEEPIYRYIRTNDREIVELDSGVYML